VSDPVRVVEGTERIHVADSITAIAGVSAPDVVVCGSHAATVAVEYAAAAGVRRLIANDAGVGKEDAGIGGLALGDEIGIAVAAVSAASARIGDGEDTFASGIVAHANWLAREAGVTPGLTAAEAAVAMARWRPSRELRRGLVRPSGRYWLSSSSPPVVGLDSASQIDASVAEAIVVCGSHGGVVAGTAIRHPVRGAFFNDAGIGKDAAGTTRLPALARLGIPACTVAAASARIGDSVDAYDNGVVSMANGPAAALGIVVGDTVRSAIARIQSDKRSSTTSSGVS
jgi:hypothetical protein